LLKRTLLGSVLSLMNLSTGLVSVLRSDFSKMGVLNTNTFSLCEDTPFVDVSLLLTRLRI